MVFMIIGAIMGGILGVKKKIIVILMSLCIVIGGAQNLYDYRGAIALIIILGATIVYFNPSLSKNFWSASFFGPSTALMDASPTESVIRSAQSEAGISGQALGQVHLGEYGESIHSPIQQPVHSESRTKWRKYYHGLICFQAGRKRDTNRGFFSPKWITGVLFFTIFIFLRAFCTIKYRGSIIF